MLVTQFDHVFWFGDLNYRIDLDFHDATELVKQKNFALMLKADQLIEEMNHEDPSRVVFPGFQEVHPCVCVRLVCNVLVCVMQGTINFAPTYRWEKKSNNFSNKRWMRARVAFFFSSYAGVGGEEWREP